MMPAQSDFGLSNIPNVYTLIYKDGYTEYLYCSNDKIAVDFAHSTLGTNGMSDLVEVVRKSGSDTVRVWWNK
jgi:hypothetical protein